MFRSVGLVSTRDTWRRSVRSWVAVGAIAATVILQGLALWSKSQSPSFIHPNKTSAYWATYTDGFVRRGLPGEIVTLLAGGSPTPTQVTVVASGLLLMSAIALVVLMTSVVLGVERPDDKLFMSTTNAIAFSLAVWSIGRYDWIGVIMMVAIAVLCRAEDVSSTSRLARAAAVGVSAAVATACEEVLFPFVVLLAVLGLYRLGYRGGKLLTLAAAVVAPSVILAVLSVLIRPSRQSLVAAISRASDAGIPVSLSKENGISTLGQSATQGLEFTLGITPLTVATFLLLIGGTYLLTTMMLCSLMPGLVNRIARVLIAAFGVAALLISALGTDYRRWWGLAFVAVLVGAVLTTPRSGISTDTPPGNRARRPVLQRTWALLGCAALILSVRLQLVNVYPDWDPTANTDFSIAHLTELDPIW